MRRERAAAYALGTAIYGICAAEVYAFANSFVLPLVRRFLA